MEPYLYVGNNPSMFTDPTGMSKQQGRDPKKKRDTPLIDGSSLVFSNSLYKNQNEIIQRLGKKIGTNANFQYINVSDDRGGNYNHKTNTITVTNNAFRYNNVYDVMSVIEHEVIHQKDKGVVKSFFDHVRVYTEQAKSDTFKKTSKEFKRSHSIAVAQRLLNSYVTQEIDYRTFKETLSDYNKINTSSPISFYGTAERDPYTQTVKVGSKTIEYDKDLLKEQ